MESPGQFSVEINSYTLLYAARHFATASAETVVRDRFDDGRPERSHDWVEIEARATTQLEGPSGALCVAST
jgi:hypothetical protein